MKACRYVCYAFLGSFRSLVVVALGFCFIFHSFVGGGNEKWRAFHIIIKMWQQQKSEQRLQQQQQQHEEETSTEIWSKWVFIMFYLMMPSFRFEFFFFFIFVFFFLPLSLQRNVVNSLEQNAMQ